MTTFRDDLTGIGVEAEVETGAPAATIASAARWEHADLVVLCSHGDTGFKRWIFQSIALQTTRACPVPVLILNEHDEAHPLVNLTHPLQVLVPLDGSALSETALASAVQFMRTLTPVSTGTLHLLRVVDIPILNGSMRGQTVIDPLIREHAYTEAQEYLDAVVKRLQEETGSETALSITTSVIVSADVPTTIIKQAEAKGCDLITLATHGRGALMRVLMGSVTSQDVARDGPQRSKTMRAFQVQPRAATPIPEPPIAKFLFAVSRKR